MLKNIVTIAALLFALGASAQVNEQTVATKDKAVFTSAAPTRIKVANTTTQPATKGQFTGAAQQRIGGNSTKQTARPTEVFGVEPRRTQPAR